MKRPRPEGRKGMPDGASFAMLGGGFILLMLACGLLLAGCATAPNIDLSNVDKSVDQSIDAAKQGIETANDIADKANKILDLGKQVKDVVAQ